MIKILCRLKMLVHFEFIYEYTNISEQFSRSHGHFQKQFAHWCIPATRKKIIGSYWFNLILFHITILTISAIVAVPFLDLHSLIPSVFFAGFISFISLTSVNYGPIFYYDFLPKLDTIIAEYEKQNEVIKDIQKCKRTQYLTPTLIIIYYALSKISNIPVLPSNDNSAELLNKLYGVSNDKLKENLSRLNKLSSLSPKERAEIQKGIDTARTFFEELSYVPAQKVLNSLEIKLKHE